jgi:DNA-binding phage protein
MTVSERSEFDALGDRNGEAEVAAYLSTVLEGKDPAGSGPANTGKACADRL